jgi:hypothetical protein
LEETGKYIANNEHWLQAIAIIAEARCAYFTRVIDQITTEQSTFAVGKGTNWLFVGNANLNGPSMKAGSREGELQSDNYLPVLEWIQSFNFE